MDYSKIVWITNEEIKGSFLYEEMTQRGVSVINPLRKVSYVGRIIRHFFFVFYLPFWPWYKRQDYSFRGFELVIIEAGLSIPLAKIIHKHNSSIKIAVWNTNSYKKKSNVRYLFLRKEGIIFSSFDPDDCHQYGLFFNPDFWFSNVSVRPSDIHYDFVFVGKPRGRENFILALKARLISLGYTVFFFTPTDSSHFLPYSDYLSLCTSATVIIDIVQANQSGLSLRPYEALFLNRKLLTNNKTILSSGFFAEANVLLISDPNIPAETLRSFLSTKYVPQTEVTKKENDFSGWISRMLDEFEEIKK